MKTLSLLCVTILFSVGQSLDAAIIRVPQEQPTIQAGIDAAQEGDTVLVADGVYFGEGNRNISFKGKAITVRSENGPEATILTAQSNRGFIFDQGETEAAVLSGFTIRDGSASVGGGIFCVDSSPTITNCIITRNNASNAGGGVYLGGISSSMIANCLITANTASNNGGGGIYCEREVSPIITNCIITQNSIYGIFCQGGTSPAIINCIIVTNTLYGIFSGDSAASILNTIVWGNRSSNNQVFRRSKATFFLYCDIQGGLDDIGNIDADPMFVDAENGDYRLQPGSPCIDAGNPAAIHNDVDGSRNDMGAYGGSRGGDWEYAPHDDEPVSGNRVLSLDGDGDYVIINPIDSFPATKITAEFWMKSSDISKRGTPISYYASSVSGNDFIIYNYNDFNPHVNDKWPGTTGVAATDGNWHHIAVIWMSSKGQLEIYKDGVIAYSATLATGESITSGGSLIIGQEQDSLGADFDPIQAFKGLIDEVRIWNTARTPEEIQATMRTTLTGNEPGLVGYWNFDDGTANDLSPFSNHGELKGDAAIIEAEFPSPPPETTGNFTLSLSPGLHMLSLPLKPAVPYTARRFANRLGSTMVIEYDEINDSFSAFLPHIATNDGFAIHGGFGYIVNLKEAKEVTFTGTIWANAPPAAHGIWAFVVGGMLPDGRETAITTRHLESNRVIEGAAVNGRFAVPLVDMNRQFRVVPGDTLEIEIDSETIIRYQVSVDDITRAYAVVSVPRRFVLYQNYPNPFNPETWLPYQLARDADVTIGIYDISGSLVRQLALGKRQAGLYLSRERAAYWDGRSETGEMVSSGLYFYQLRAGNSSATKRMVILK